MTRDFRNTKNASLNGDAQDLGFSRRRLSLLLGTLFYCKKKVNDNVLREQVPHAAYKINFRSLFVRRAL